MRSDLGVTLIELLIVLGLTALLIAGAGMVSFEQFGATHSREDRNALIDALLLARARAQSDGNAAHGVYIENDRFIVFEGSSYALRTSKQDTAFPHSSSRFTGDIEFLFVSGSGRAQHASSVRIGEHPEYLVDVTQSGSITSSL